MLHHMSLQPEPFRKVKSGEKTIELRLNDEKRQRVSVGDQIEFRNLADDSQTVQVCVRAIHRFASFSELYRTLPLTSCGYRAGEKADPRDMDPYYSREEQQRYGVVGIEMKLIP